MNTEFKIIKIIDENTLLINGGVEDGLNNGDKLEIYEIGEIVIDPFSKKKLGTLDTIKAIIYVDTALPKMAICRPKCEKKLVNLQNLLYEEEVASTLKVDKSKISGGLQTDLTIKIGDTVRKSTGD